MKKQHGNFTGLAGNYSQYRPAYAPAVLSALLGVLEKPAETVDLVDVGAGTGIWTRMAAARGLASVTAIEPNDDMRSHGIADSEQTGIQWRQGSGEATGLADASADWVSMASSFHWVDFDQGTAEFARILRPGGWFTALWNPRYIEANPLLMEIEQHLHALVPELTRVSSGRSGITATLTEQLKACPHFDAVIALEGWHTVRQSPEAYLGVWWSVNDIRHQAGEARFGQFMDYVSDKVKGLDFIETTYQTRAWSARKVG